MHKNNVFLHKKLDFQFEKVYNINKVYRFRSNFSDGKQEMKVRIRHETKQYVSYDSGRRKRKSSSRVDE